MKYCLVADDSGHDYVIPADKRIEWYRLLDLPEEEFDLPNWAKMVEGGLEFENPSINGKLLFERKIISIDFSTCENWDECMKWMDGAPDYRTDYDNWLKYWKDSGLINERQFI